MRKTKLFLIFFVLALGFFLFAPTNKALAADSISYESPQYYEINVDNVNLTPTISGSGYTFSVSPALPEGLSLNTETGVIFGQPYVTASEKVYTVTAVNSNGSQSFELSLATLAKPRPLSYNNYDFFRFFSINKSALPNLIPDVAQLENNDILYSISPDLPEGLVIDQQNGVISGFPVEISSTTSYTVKVENPLGSSTSTVSITVFMPWNKLGENVSESGASGPFLYSNTKKEDSYYVAYNDTNNQKIVVSSYATSTKSWIPLGNPINAQGTQIKITLDSNETPYVSYNSSGQVFIRKYERSTGNWESVSSIVNDDEEASETSTISSTAVSYDSVINSSNSTFVSYVDGAGVVNINKLIESGGSYSEIDNMSVVAPNNLSYRATSTFSTNYTIDPMLPAVSGGPTRFVINPQLPRGMQIDSYTGVISGTPLIANGENTYTVTASNAKGSTSTQFKITVDGPWKDIRGNLPIYAGLFSEGKTIEDDNGDIYISYFSASSTQSINGLKPVIYKRDASSGVWSNLFSGSDLVFNSPDGNSGSMSMQIVDAMALHDGVLYAIVSDFFVDFSNGMESGIENMIAKSTLRKYNADSSSWEDISVFDILSNPMGESMSKFDMHFVQDELFLTSYDSTGLVDVRKFVVPEDNSTDGVFESYRMFETIKVSSSQDKEVMAADDNYVYIGYSDYTNSVPRIGVHRFSVADGTWADFSDDLSGLGIELSSKNEPLTFDSLIIDNSGVPYFSYNYNGCVVDTGTTCKDYSVVKKIDGESLVLVSEEIGSVGYSNSIGSIKLAIDKSGYLWSSINVFEGNFIRKYNSSTGVWDKFLNEKVLGQGLNLDLFFDANNNLMISSMDDGYFGSVFAKYDENATTTPNRDSSSVPSITFPKNTYNFVVGKKIDAIYPIVSGSVTAIKFCEYGGCFYGLENLDSYSGVISGTPLVATSSVFQVVAYNGVLSSEPFELHINVVDPWVPLGEPLSSSANSISLAVDSANGLDAVYSEYSSENSVNVIKASRYENETWTSLGDYVSDISKNAINPKIVTQQSNIYVAYSDSDSGELLVKKYNSQEDSWDQLGGKINDGAYQDFSIITDYDDVMIIFYDTDKNRLVLKKYNNGYWDVKGSYIENAYYPTLASGYHNNEVYVSYLSNSSLPESGDLVPGALIVDKYEELNYSVDGKKIILDNIGSLIESGDMSPQGSASATSTEAVKFNQRLNIIPFTGASILIPSGVVMSASSTFDTVALVASSTVNLHDLNVGNFTPAGTLMFGLPDLGLTLSAPITISIPVPNISEGKQLKVYSKTAGDVWKELTTCYVIAGQCSFQTTHLSEFAAGEVVVPVSGGGGGYIPPADVTCTDVTYSAFSNICSGGFFTRSVLTSLPSGCSLSTAQLAALKQACVMPEEENPEEVTATSTATSTVDVVKDTVTTVLKEVKDAFIKLEKSLIKTINKLLTKKLLGRILLQVESHGEAWYLDPISSVRYYLADGDTAYTALRQFGLGITNANIAKIPVGTYSYKGDIDTDKDGLSDKIENGLGTNPNLADSDKDGIKDGDEVLKKNTNPLNKTKLSYSTSLINKLKGRIVIQTEKKGEAWYINPADGKRYYLADGPMAYQVMRFLSLGITNNNIRQIKIGEMK